MYNATQLVSGHLNDSQRDFAYCNAPQFNATICLLLFASSRSASQRDLSRRGATHLSATLLNDLFITSRLNSPRRGTPRRGTPHRTSTQRFVCYNASPRGSASHRAPRLPAAHRASIQLNDLFVTSRRSKAQRSATLHAFRQRSSPQFNATN